MSGQHWKLRHKAGDRIIGAGGYPYGEHTDTLYARLGRFAGDYVGGNAHELKVGCHYNGSGSAYFGGAKQWPYVTLGVSFPTGKEALAERLGEELREFVDLFLSRHGLDQPGDDE